MHKIRCVRACDGAECVQKFADAVPGTYDAILMDMQMPVMNGLEAAAAIRALPYPEASRIPILALTANAYQEDIRRCLDAGMNAHLAKPLNMDTVLRTLMRYLKE